MCSTRRAREKRLAANEHLAHASRICFRGPRAPPRRARLAARRGRRLAIGRPNQQTVRAHTSRTHNWRAAHWYSTDTACSRDWAQGIPPPLRSRRATWPSLARSTTESCQESQRAGGLGHHLEAAWSPFEAARRDAGMAPYPRPVRRPRGRVCLAQPAACSAVSCSGDPCWA